MSHQAIIDTGPLVAFLDADDRHHQWVKDRFRELRPPLLTCEAVIAETLHLLRALPTACERIFQWIERGVVTPAFFLDDEARSIHSLYRKYRDVPMSLADARLVTMAEIHPHHLIFTLDSDFVIYRKNRTRALMLWIPNGKTSKE